MTEYVPIPDEELTEPIHLSVGPREMRCGADAGIGVLDERRVTCPACQERPSDTEGRLTRQ